MMETQDSGKVINECHINSKDKDPLQDKARNRHLEEMYRTKIAMDVAKYRGNPMSYNDLRKHLELLQRQLAVYDRLEGY